MLSLGARVTFGAKVVEQPGGALDVRQKKRDGAVKQIITHGSRLSWFARLGRPAP